MAQECDLELDDNLIQNDHTRKKGKQNYAKNKSNKTEVSRDINTMRKQLDAVLKMPLIANNLSRNYFTLNNMSTLASTGKGQKIDLSKLRRNSND